MMIEIRDLSKKYRNHKALQNLSLSVSEGSALVVVGANGAGKTTMIKILMNLIEATSGTAEVLGVDSRRLSPKQLTKIGYVSEDQLLPAKLTVSEYLNYLRPFYPTWDKQLEAETLEQFRLPRDRRIDALSHGMRLKMTLACALPYRPKLLVLDEPCSGLDPLVRDEFMEGLMEHAGEMTVLMSTHELSEVEGFGTDVAYIEEGRLMFHESMEALTGRMQEIRVTTSRKGKYRQPPPKSWIDVKEAGNVVTFVHREFLESELEAQVRASIADVVRIEAIPMSLRSICLTGARGTRPEELRRRPVMVWHIFRKDWKLAWKLFVAVAMIEFLPAIIRVKLGFFGEDPTLEYLLTPLGHIVILVSALLTIAVVQLDSIPSVREDWLTRPVPRGDLLLAKLMFAVVLVQGTVLLADTFLCMATGFSLGPAVMAALAHNLYWVLVVTLPAFMLASITRNMPEAIVAGVLGVCGTGAILIFAVARGGQEAYLRDTLRVGEAWVARYCSYLLVLLGACAILGLQYFRRKTTAVRWLAGSGLLLFVAVQQFLPWKMMFAVERRMSQNPAADRSLVLDFNPSMGRYQDPSGIGASFGTKPEAYLPIRVASLPKDAVLHADKSELRIIDPDGHVVYRGEGDNWDFRPGEEAKTTVYQKLSLPGSFYTRFKDQPLRLEFDYSLTLFRASASYGVPALHGDLRTPGLGICETEMNGTGTAVELSCKQAGNSTQCRSSFLEDTATGQHNPEMYICKPDYSPSLERAEKTPLSSFGLILPFRDPAGLTRYPVQGPQLPKSDVMVTLYEPEDHFVRHLTIASVKLAEWGLQ